MHILQINSSIRTHNSLSSQLADAISGQLQQCHPGASLEILDLARQPHPALDQAALTALMTPEAQRSPEQAARVALDDAQIARLQQADALVLGVPMYNFGIPAGLKNWIDAVCRARVTFRYTEQGPEGLLKGKRVYVALTRGGVHRDTPQDTQVPYLKTLLGFLGMTDVHFIYAEGLALGEEAVGQAFAAAREQIALQVKQDPQTSPGPAAGSSTPAQCP